jgi:tetratricopeptide (TPR) repeat protein
MPTTISVITCWTSVRSLTEIREALRLEPKNPHYQDSLGWALVAKGDLTESLAALHEASHLQKEDHNAVIQTHLRHVERLKTLEARLDAILRSQDMLGADDRLDLAELCRVKGRFADSARFYHEAFQNKSARAEDLKSQHRLHAAIAAARAGTDSIPGGGNPSLDETQRAHWRIRALAWLRAEKDECARIIAQGPTEEHALARKTLDILTHHRDLACVRKPDALATLALGERNDWQAFWAEVAALLKKVRSS